MMMNGIKYYNIKEEIWLQIKGFPGYYINQFGQVKRRYKNGKELILKQHQNRDGYYRVKLFNKSIKKNYRVNRLILEVFTGTTNQVSHHIDNNRQNNNIWNLKWLTIKENNQPENRKQKVSD